MKKKEELNEEVKQENVDIPLSSGESTIDPKDEIIANILALNRFFMYLCGLELKTYLIIQK